ncbi:MAG: hypothetical protein WD844_13065 [Thermoleophilaceae bacterium]
MRPRDPRRLLPRTERLARVDIVEEPESRDEPDGSVTSRQVARITLPREELDRIWRPEYLERLARTYWRYLTRISLGLLKVVYTESSRQVVLIGRPLVLLRFHAPEYDAEATKGVVTWRIHRGLLVAPRGRGHGFLRITVERAPDEGAQDVTVRVSSEVSNFYPVLAASRPGGRGGTLGRLARWFYAVTQLRIHVIVTHGFLRSLARLDLEPSVVGSLKAAIARDQPTETAGR